jgi:[ribosomal protein S18]-alanine N-acetyltransferase
MIINGREVLLRRMLEQDIDWVLEIERLSFARPWSRESFVSELTSNLCARYCVLIEDGRIVAFGGMWLIIGEAHINNIAVHPDFRQRGYGRMIMKELMRVAYRAGEIIQMTLEVRVTNVPAIDLYTSMGFEVAGRRKGYYEDNGEDAYIMWCHNTVVNLV